MECCTTSKPKSKRFRLMAARAWHLAQTPTTCRMHKRKVWLKYPKKKYTQTNSVLKTSSGWAKEITQALLRVCHIKLTLFHADCSSLRTKTRTSSNNFSCLTFMTPKGGFWARQLTYQQKKAKLSLRTALPRMARHLSSKQLFQGSM